MNKEAFLKKKALGKNDFNDGLLIGCVAGGLWYILWIALAIIIFGKTGSVFYMLGALSVGALAVWWLNDIVKLFLLDTRQHPKYYKFKKHL